MRPLSYTLKSYISLILAIQVQNITFTSSFSCDGNLSMVPKKTPSECLWYVQPKTNFTALCLFRDGCNGKLFICQNYIIKLRMIIVIIMNQRYCRAILNAKVSFHHKVANCTKQFSAQSPAELLPVRAQVLSVRYVSVLNWCIVATRYSHTAGKLQMAKSRLRWTVNINSSLSKRPAELIYVQETVIFIRSEKKKYQPIRCSQLINV